MHWKQENAATFPAFCRTQLMDSPRINIRWPSTVVIPTPHFHDKNVIQQIGEDYFTTIISLPLLLWIAYLGTTQFADGSWRSFICRSAGLVCQLRTYKIRTNITQLRYFHPGSDKPLRRCHCDKAELQECSNVKRFSAVAAFLLCSRMYDAWFQIMCWNTLWKKCILLIKHG